MTNPSESHRVYRSCLTGGQPLYITREDTIARTAELAVLATLPGRSLTTGEMYRRACELTGENPGIMASDIGRLLVRYEKRGRAARAILDGVGSHLWWLL